MGMKFDNGDKAPQKRNESLQSWGKKLPHHTRADMCGRGRVPVVVADFFRHVRFSVRFPPGEQKQRQLFHLAMQTGWHRRKHQSERVLWGQAEQYASKISWPIKRTVGQGTWFHINHNYIPSILRLYCIRHWISV